MDIKLYQTKADKLAGTRYEEVLRKAVTCYSDIKKKSKRQPYVRSSYFHKDKIFLSLFWGHMHQKNWRERVLRARYFVCALEVLQNSRLAPLSKQNPNDPNEVLHRFFGMTAGKETFVVQVKEDKRSGKKWLISIFPKEL